MPGQRVYVAGHRGLAGSAIAACLRDGGYDVLTATREELDLHDQAATYRYIAETKPDVVILAAATVGGIQANRTRPAEFIGNNVIIEHNVIWGSHIADVQELLFLGSSCMYPRITAQPMPESALLTGELEPTNAPYAIAKFAGLSLCESLSRQYGRRYFTAIPPNLYGPGDNYDLEAAHVLPAMLRKFHEAKVAGEPVRLWGSGTPKREFLTSGDLALACRFLLEHGSTEPCINVGTGKAITIRHLAETIQRIVGHAGGLEWDASMPDGFPEKTLDVSKLFAMGWRPTVELDEGITSTYAWFVDALENGAVRCG